MEKLDFHFCSVNFCFLLRVTVIEELATQWLMSLENPAASDARLFFETAASLENTWCTNIKRKHRNANIWPQTPIDAHFRKLNIFLGAFWSGTHAKRRICCFFRCTNKALFRFSIYAVYAQRTRDAVCLLTFFFFFFGKNGLHSCLHSVLRIHRMCESNAISKRASPSTCPFSGCTRFCIRKRKMEGKKET